MMKYRPFVWLAGFLLLAEIGLRNDLQKFYLKVKSVEALSDFHLAQLLINFNGSLLKNEVKSNKWNFVGAHKIVLF
jgi:hypothetical protein